MVNSHRCGCSGQTNVDDKPHFCSSVQTALLSLVRVLESEVPIFFVVNLVPGGMLYEAYCMGKLVSGDDMFSGHLTDSRRVRSPL